MAEVIATRILLTNQEARQRNANITAQWRLLKYVSRRIQNIKAVFPNPEGKEAKRLQTLERQKERIETVQLPRLYGITPEVFQKLRPELEEN